MNDKQKLIELEKTVDTLTAKVKDLEASCEHQQTSVTKLYDILNSLINEKD